MVKNLKIKSGKKTIYTSFYLLKVEHLTFYLTVLPLDVWDILVARAAVLV